jgi:hypothetical protein
MAAKRTSGRGGRKSSSTGRESDRHSEWIGSRPGRSELKQAGLSPRDACLEVCDDAQIWRTADGETFATIVVENHREHHAVYGRDFRDWVLSRVAATYAQNGRPATAGDNAMKGVRSSLDARAYVDQVRYPAPLRVAKFEDECIFIDTGWPDWQAIEVSPDGWAIVPASPTPIIRSRRTGAMVMPATSPDFSLFRMLLRDLPEAEFVLFLSWCLMALWPDGPYPIMLITGEHGTGKSTKLRVAQRLIDPVTDDLLAPAKDDRDLAADAKQHRVLAFDNVSTLTAELADSICRLSTGSQLGGRALFTDNDSASFAACRPVMLNGIPNLATRGDFADRSLVIKLSARSTWLSEGEFWAKADEALPGALAGLLDALVLGLQEFSLTKTPNVRMADFAKLIVAAEPRLPWRRGAFLEAYAGNRSNINAVAVEADEVATRLLAFIEQHGNWSGLVKELYDELSREISPEQRRTIRWPGSARWFSDAVTRAAPALRVMGIDVATRHTNRGTVLTVIRVASLASQSVENGGNEPIPG